MHRRASTKGYLPTLDGWRAIAISGVIASHIFLGAEGHVRFDWLWHLMGPKGVSLFFGISGFLITWRLLEEREKFGAISLRGFYIRRACRILPASLTYLGVIGALALVGLIKVNPHSWFSALCFYRDYNNTDDWFTGHFWSLSIEEHFYLFWPALLVFLGLARSVWTASFLSVCVVGWRAADLSHHWVEKVLPNAAFWFRTDTRLDAFLLACIAAVFFYHKTDGGQRRIQFPGWGWLIVFALYLGCAFHNRHSPSATIFELGQAIAIPLLIAGTVFSTGWGVSRLLENVTLRWIGRISYSLYLWQQLFLGDGRIHGLAFRLAAVFLCATASFYLIEKPMIRLGHRLAPPASWGRGDLLLHSGRVSTKLYPRPNLGERRLGVR